MSEATQYAEKAIEFARSLGAEHGKAAATWVTDGNTTEATARPLLKGLDVADQEVWDALPTPDLSGEWADSMTGPELVTEALDEAGAIAALSESEYGDLHADLFSDICDAYEAAFSEAVQDEVTRACKHILGQ